MLIMTAIINLRVLRRRSFLRSSRAFPAGNEGVVPLCQNIDAPYFAGIVCRPALMQLYEPCDIVCVDKLSDAAGLY